jgi:hypothetical protein
LGGIEMIPMIQIGQVKCASNAHSSLAGQLERLAT